MSTRIQVPEAFKRRMLSLPGLDWPAFEQALFETEKTSVRRHPVKGKGVNFSGQPVAWEPLGIILDQRPHFAHDPHWHAGAYYVQESSSMLTGAVFEQLTHGQNGLKVLDLCAAPGGKSTHLLSQMSADSLLVSNELISKRNKIFCQNLDAWGYSNVIVTQNEAFHFASAPDFFDVIVVDAPCSGEGLFRRQPEAVNEWSEAAVEQCSIRQSKILSDITPALKPGGLLLYSTCTFETDENEARVQALLDTGQFDLVHIDFSAWKGVSEGYLHGTLRCYPHHVEGSGFFIAALRKRSEAVSTVHRPTSYRNFRWQPVQKKLLEFLKPFVDLPAGLSPLQSGEEVRVFPSALLYDLEYLANFLSVKSFGTEAGRLRKEFFTPGQGLCFSRMTAKDIPCLEVDRETALRFLRKQDISLPDAPQGWATIAFEGQNLGWAKVLRDRINNYFPVEIMLRN